MSIDKATIVVDLYSTGLSSADISQLILWHRDDQSRLIIISSILKNANVENLGKRHALRFLLATKDISPSFLFEKFPTINDGQGGPVNTDNDHRINGGLWE